jgi:hypothetical protein
VEVAVFLIVIALVGLVVLVLTGPLRAHAQARHSAREEAARADLEAAKEAKYREIRDAELDYRTGKLSEADWRAIDRDLRAEAVEILRRLDELEEGPPGGQP